MTSMTTVTLWLVRHAQPQVARGVCYGHTDMRAEPEATQICAEALAKVLPAGIVGATSTLQRCEQLTQSLLGMRPDLVINPNPQLREMNFGQWEGRVWNEIPRAELDAWTADFADYAVGHSGESVARFMSRVALAFDALPTTQDTLWVTHAGVIRAVQLLARGQRQVTQADQWPIEAPAYGQWCKLRL